MRGLIAFLIILNYAHLSEESNLMLGSNIDPLSDLMIQAINKLNTSWTAGKNFHSQNMDYVKSLLGTIKGNKKLAQKSDYESIHIPKNFDARKKWPKCTSIKLIRDQSRCGSCWAFGAAESISDRICIASRGQIMVNISALDIVTCCDACGEGCYGGTPSMAWDYWVSDGIVSGGLYHGEGCRPYTLPPCQPHTSPNCSYLPTPSCQQKCQKGYPKTYKQDKYFGKNVYSVKSVKHIQQEIMLHGPVEADFTVYADFISYKRGVYQRHSNQAIGGHAIKILGWGTENGVDYWLCANSWNTDFGEEGFFKIKRGTNECEIEDDIVAGIPKLKV